MSFAVSRHSSVLKNLAPWTWICALTEQLLKGRKNAIYTLLQCILSICNCLSWIAFYGCVPLRWSGLGSVIQDHFDHGTCKSNEAMNPFPGWIYQFLWCTLNYHLNECTLLLISSIIRYLPTVNSDLILFGCKLMGETRTVSPKRIDCRLLISPF